MDIQIELIGKTPLVMHNERLADPLNSFVKQIAEFTDKASNQTDDDRRQVGKLEWFGGLYEHEGRIVVPSANVVRCFREAAAITKDGKNIARALIPGEMFLPLIYDGPQDIKKLYENEAYTFRRPVKVGRARIVRVRPCFARWRLVAPFMLLEDVMNLAKLKTIGDLAGRATGLCDARIIGCGRFECKITKAA